jgi:ribokinase
MSIVVVGSLNIDRFSMVERLPRPGETVIARQAFTRFGGKGANQAVAAARLGARVAMIGAVGADDSGRAYRQRLETGSIDIRGLVEKPGVDTGAAAIAVEASGENCIIVDSGANGQLTAADVRAARAVIAGASVMLVQLEVPLDAVVEAMRLAQAEGARVVFNPSPWRDDLPWTELALHTVIVNETEARVWLGEQRFPAGLQLGRLVITQGAGPTLRFTSAASISAVPPSIKPVDTVGAGDTFAGAYAVALAEGRALADALRFANAAGATATLHPGAQEAMPDRRTVDELLAVTTPPPA